MYLENPLLQMSTYLDPRFNRFPFRGANSSYSTADINAIEEYIINTHLKYEEMLRLHTDGTATDSESTSTDTVDAANPDPDMEFDLQNPNFDFVRWALRGMASDDHQVMATDDYQQGEEAVVPAAGTDNITNSRARIITELQCYRTLATISLDSDPMKWWAAHEREYPLLSIMSLKVLSAPPSSVESERVFSHGGNIVTHHRNRLTAENSSRLIFCNFNLRLLESLHAQYNA